MTALPRVRIVEELREIVQQLDELQKTREREQNSSNFFDKRSEINQRNVTFWPRGKKKKHETTSRNKIYRNIE